MGFYMQRNHTEKRVTQKEVIYGKELGIKKHYTRNQFIYGKHFTHEEIVHKSYTRGIVTYKKDLHIRRSSI